MNDVRAKTNWESKLRPEELMDKKAGNQVMKTVLLKGLQRLGKEAGLIKNRCQILNPSPNVVQAIYETEFDDGTIWVGCADCNSKNTNPPYIDFPTAVAESRAEARSLRKALGIVMLSAEEIDISPALGEVDPNKKIDSSVLVAIEQLCESKDLSKIDLINAIISDRQRANTIFELKQLTVEEGQRAMQHLNSLKEKKKEKKK